MDIQPPLKDAVYSSLALGESSFCTLLKTKFLIFVFNALSFEALNVYSNASHRFSSPSLKTSLAAFWPSKILKASRKMPNENSSSPKKLAASSDNLKTFSTSFWAWVVTCVFMVVTPEKKKRKIPVAVCAGYGLNTTLLLPLCQYFFFSW